MSVGWGFSTVPMLCAFALLGAVFSSPAHATPTSPIPPRFLRRNYSLVETADVRTMAPLAASASVSVRLKMIREKSEDGDRPAPAISVPRLPVAFALVPALGPACTPGPSRPHLRC